MTSARSPHPTARPGLQAPASRRAVLAGAAAAALAAAGGVAGARPAAAAAAARTSGSPLVVQSAASGLPFMLGASGDGVADGSYAAALGRRLDLVSTWADSDWASTNLPVLAPGGALAGWAGAVDVALGAFEGGTTWAQAAAGACDARWTASLTALAALRARTAGTTYVRFAHEMNGNWYSWGVPTAARADFVAAWRRYRALQQRIFPAARLVFSMSHNTLGYDADATTLFPGAGQADVVGVDYYNRYPYLGTAAAFAAHLGARDDRGGPAGLEAYRRFAQSVGLPLCLPEWSLVADATGGDSPAFVAGLHDWALRHAGAGPGQVLYASQFNVSAGHGGDFNLVVGSRMPLASAEYRRRFGRV